MKENTVEGNNLTDGSSYVHIIPSKDSDSFGIAIEYIDADFPLGEMSTKGANVVVNKWLDENYPNISKEQLSDLGIDVTYVPGTTTYYIGKEEVSEADYNEKAASMQLTEGESPYSINDEILYYPNGRSTETLNGKLKINEFGKKYTSNGQIEVTINSSVLESIGNKSLDENSRNKLNELIEEKTGIKDAIKKGMSIKNSYKDFKKLIKEVASEEGSKVNATLIFISLITNKAMDITDLENFWDADNSEILDEVNKLSKAGKILFTIAGISGLSIGVTEEAKIGAFLGIIDELIKDGDHQELVKLDANGNLEWDFDYKTTSGHAAHYNKDIKIAEDPTMALNEVYSYLEMAKIILCNRIKEIESKRAPYIKKVQADIASEMANLDILSATDTECKRLWQIYEIDWTVLTKDSYHYYNNSSMYVGAEEFYYEIIFNYSIADITITQNEIIVLPATISFTAPQYDGSIISDVVIYRDRFKYSDEELNQIGIDFINSVYNYHYINSDEVKNTFIDNIVTDPNINVGKVDSTDVTVEDYINESGKTHANYMSKTRFALAMALTNNFYSEVLRLGAWHSDFIKMMQEEDAKLAGAITNSNGGN